MDRERVMMSDDPRAPRADKTDCDHRLFFNITDETSMPHWDCIRCGAVAFFDPSKPGVRISRPS